MKKQNKESLDQFYKELFKEIKTQKPNKLALAKLKIKLCAKHKLKKIPTDINLLLNAPKLVLPLIKQYLITKPTRSISGVAVVAIMCKPHKCPHGKCTVCPGGLNSEFGNVPQSYTGREPATMRAIRNNYDPYLQVFNRLEQYIVSGHIPDKVELIVMGGTFPSLNKAYQKNFIRLSLKAMNDFSRLFFNKKQLNLTKFKTFFELPGEVGDEKRAKSIKSKLSKEKIKQKTDLEKEQKKNETSNIKCVGLTLETRPDYGRLNHGNFALELGATRIELGIEAIDNNILEKIQRGHDLQESIDAISELKDIGFKLNYHFMLGLPGSTKKSDINALKQLYSDENFKPDMLKIYPSMVMKGTKVYDDYKKGKYKPLTTKDACEIITEFKRFVPKYTRIMRIQRDIPTYQTQAGVDKTNLRQYVDQLAKKKGIQCQCIRCREAGRAKKIENVVITTTKYVANKGTEFFIAAEDEKNNALVGYLRLRFPMRSLRKEITINSALIRELHVYGAAASIGEKSKSKLQHKGWGKKLLQTAEKICKQHKKDKILIISGIGVREYYRKFNYKKQGPYMIKKLI